MNRLDTAGVFVDAIVAGRGWRSDAPFAQVLRAMLEVQDDASRANEDGVLMVMRPPPSSSTSSLIVLHPKRSSTHHRHAFR